MDTHYLINYYYGKVNMPFCGCKKKLFMVLKH